MSAQFSKKIDEYKRFYKENREIIEKLNDLRHELRTFVFYSNSPYPVIDAIYKPFDMDKCVEICEILKLRKSELDELILGDDKHGVCA